MCLSYLLKGECAMKTRGNEVLWLSEKGNVAVTYAQFDLGAKYKIFRKVKYGDNSVWEFNNAFGTQGESIKYAKQILDVEIER